MAWMWKTHKAHCIAGTWVFSKKWPWWQIKKNETFAHCWRQCYCCLIYFCRCVPIQLRTGPLLESNLGNDFSIHHVGPVKYSSSLFSTRSQHHRLLRSNATKLLHCCSSIIMLTYQPQYSFLGVSCLVIKMQRWNLECKYTIYFLWIEFFLAMSDDSQPPRIHAEELTSLPCTLNQDQLMTATPHVPNWKTSEASMPSVDQQEIEIQGSSHRPVSVSERSHEQICSLSLQRALKKHRPDGAGY